MDSLLEPEDRLREQYLRAPWGELGRTCTLGVVSLLSKLLLNALNTTAVEGLAAFQEHVQRRPQGLGLITVSNHTSTVDDPALLSAMLPWSFYLSEHRHGRVRWSLCARELCYRTPLLAAFFASGKTLPIERGAGPGQPVMRVAAGLVARGGWVHIFPEGRINYSGKLGAVRWGVGKMVCDAANAGGRTPTVLPFYHSGMGRVMPRRARVPRAGHRVAVVVGEPIELEDLVGGCSAEGEEERRCTWRDIADRVAAALHALEASAPRNPDQHAAGLQASEGALPAEP